jgi:hypothetical protein
MNSIKIDDSFPKSISHALVEHHDYDAPVMSEKIKFHHGCSISSTEPLLEGLLEVRKAFDGTVLQLSNFPQKDCSIVTPVEQARYAIDNPEKLFVSIGGVDRCYISMFQGKVTLNMRVPLGSTSSDSVRESIMKDVIDICYLLINGNVLPQLNNYLGCLPEERIYIYSDYPGDSFFIYIYSKEALMDSNPYRLFFLKEEDIIRWGTLGFEAIEDLEDLKQAIGDFENWKQAMDSLGTDFD